jgi:hypothetical protein
MATFQNTVTIRRAIDDVFAFLADFENVPTWNYAIVETKKTSPGPVGVGPMSRAARAKLSAARTIRTTYGHRSHPPGRR